MLHMKNYTKLKYVVALLPILIAVGRREIVTTLKYNPGLLFPLWEEVRLRRLFFIVYSGTQCYYILRDI